MTKKNIVLDSQILSSLMRCPAYTDYVFNQNLVGKSGKSNALECGSLVHTILEFYGKATIKGASRSAAILEGLEAGNEYIRSYSPSNKYITDVDHVGVRNTPKESGKNERGKEVIGTDYVFKTMDEYFDYYRNDSTTVIACEEVRGEVLYEDDDMRILYKAKFDAIVDTNAGIISRDYKSESIAREKLSLDNQFMGQCVLLHSRQIQIDRIGFQKSLKPQQKFIRELIPYSVDRLAEWQYETLPHYVRMLIAYSESNNWPMNFNGCDKYFTCQFYREICSTDRNLRKGAIEMHFVKGKPWNISND